MNTFILIAIILIIGIVSIILYKKNKRKKTDSRNNTVNRKELDKKQAIDFSSLPISLEDIDDFSNLQGEDILLSENQNRYFSDLINNYLDGASDEFKAKGSELLLTYSSDIRSKLSQGITNLTPFVSKSFIANPQALAALAGVAIVTAAGQYLVTLNHKIDDIKVGIDEIKKMLNQERWAKTLGNFQHLKTYSNNLKDNANTFEDVEFIKLINSSIESIECECLQIFEATYMQLDNIKNEIPNEKEMTKGSLLNFNILNTNKNKIIDKIDKYIQMQMSYLLAIQVANFGAQLKSSLPTRRDIIIDRIKIYEKHLLKSKNHFKEFNNSIEDCIQLLKTNSLKSLISSDNPSLVKEEIKDYLINQLENYNVNSNKIESDLMLLEKQILSQIKESNRPLSFAISMNKAGRILSLKKILS